MVYLGEIYVQNKFVLFDDLENVDIVMKLFVGICNICLIFNFYYIGDCLEELELIDYVDFEFKVMYVEYKEGVKWFDFDIEGIMIDFNFCIIFYQFNFFFELFRFVFVVFVGGVEQSDEEVECDVDDVILECVRIMIGFNSESSNEKFIDMGFEFGIYGQVWMKLDFVFMVNIIGLELICVLEDVLVGDMDVVSFFKFSLDLSVIKIWMDLNGSFEVEFVIQVFIIFDIWYCEINKFCCIMMSNNKDV